MTHNLLERLRRAAAFRARIIASMDADELRAYLRERAASYPDSVVAHRVGDLGPGERGPATGAAARVVKLDL